MSAYRDGGIDCYKMILTFQMHINEDRYGQ